MEYVFVHSIFILFYIPRIAVTSFWSNVVVNLNVKLKFIYKCMEAIKNFKLRCKWNPVFNIATNFHLELFVFIFSTSLFLLNVCYCSFFTFFACNCFFPEIAIYAWLLLVLCYRVNVKLMLSWLTMGTLKTLRFNCSIVNQFEMCHIFFKMYLFLCQHFELIQFSCLRGCSG